MNQFRRMMMQGTPPADVPDIDWEDLPHESIVFEFPLYLNITDFEEEDEWTLFYLRTPDEVSQQLYQWLTENIHAAGIHPVVPLPVSIYFNGVLGIETSPQGDNYAIYGEFEHFNEVLVYNDGSIYGIIYK